MYGTTFLVIIHSGVPRTITQVSRERSFWIIGLVIAAIALGIIINVSFLKKIK